MAYFLNKRFLFKKRGAERFSPEILWRLSPDKCPAQDDLLRGAGSLLDREIGSSHLN